MITLYGLAVSPDGGDLYAVSGIGSAVVQFRREPAGGALTFAACTTSNNGVSACSQIPGAAFAGVDTGLSGLRGVAISPDGRNLYTAAEHGDAVATFARDTSTGALTYVGCVSSDSDVGGCAQLPGSVADGTNTPLAGLRSVTVSPDGSSVHVAAAGSDAVTTFARDQASGALTFLGCTTSSTTTSGCTTIPGATASGTNTGLDQPYSVAVSPDGKSTYAAGFDGYSIARFDRAANGALNYRDCLSSKTTVTGCTPVPTSTTNGDDSSLGNATSVTVSADGRSVYAAAEFAATLTHFARDPAGGALSQVECFTTNADLPGCTQVPGAASNAANSPLENLEAAVASDDGNNVYVASYEGSLARFDRDPASGTLTYADCLTAAPEIGGGCTALPVSAANGVNTAFHSLSSLALSPDGRNLYAGAEAGSAVSRLLRERPSNAFSFGKLKRNKRKGTAKLTVTVPGRGSLSLTGKGLRASARDAAAAGEVALPVKAKGKAAKRLRRKGKLKRKAEVTFAPPGNDANTAAKRVKLIRKT